jgi:hypothetical protein
VSAISQPIHPKGDPREPNLSFSHAMAKVGWADHIIQRLHKGNQRLFKSYAEAKLARCNEKTRAYEVAETALPVEIPLLAGDAIFNLRSALDCCWMGLRRAIDADADKGTLPRGLRRQEVEGTIHKASIEHAFQGIGAFVLDKVKPYREGNEELWLAGQIDNWNKHNMLMMAVRATTIVDFQATVGGMNIIIKDCQFIGNTKPFGVAPGLDFKVDREPDLAFDISLIWGKSLEERPLMPFLSAVLKDTHEAVQGFIAAFGTKP